MPDRRLSDLTVALPLRDGDEIAIVQEVAPGVLDTRRVTLAALREMLLGAINGAGLNGGGRLLLNGGGNLLLNP